MSLKSAAIQGGVGQGLEKMAGNIMNAFFMKKRLEVQKQLAEAQKEKAAADTRKSDAYTNYLKHRDYMQSAVDMHNEMPAILQAQATKVAGPGSTALQLATRNAPMPGVANAPPTPERAAPNPRGMATAQPNPAPARRPPPATQSPAMPPIPAADPRMLVQPQDGPLFADDDAT